MTVHGRYPRTLADSPVFDWPYNALPGVDQDTFVRTNIPVYSCTSDLAATGTSVAIGTRVFLRKGDVVTSLTFVSGNTAAATLTAWAHALYDPDGTLLSQTADQGSAAWAANTAKKLALSEAQTIEEDGWYIAATSTTATTVQTLIGAAPIVTATAGVHTGSLALGFTFGSSLAGTFPAAAGTLTGVAKCPLVIVS
ncbi:hypothetical protein HS041_12300 [Planomonospora sp. ID67723]|uniref:hypothetical protein n=1 Tax=Planomonospora sp. ID67723 TaxID=2738134 RepID=UPI0018C394F9|nr:hypothetical protein [Planomonospora sp. ID67723]MBG0828550.1 hypothetical protein [Planomonospora sp. ID67723]